MLALKGYDGDNNFEEKSRGQYSITLGFILQRHWLL